MTAVKGFKIVSPIRDLTKLNKGDRVTKLTKGIPSVIKDADDDCRMMVNQYLHILEYGFWRDVSDSPEEYFLTYWKYPIEWLEYLRIGIECLDSGKPIPLPDKTN